MPGSVIQGTFPHGLSRITAAPQASGAPQADWVRQCIAAPSQRSAANSAQARFAGAPRPPLPAPPVARPSPHGMTVPLPQHLANIPLSGGQPLPTAIVQRMESFFGARFGDVRIHIGAHAAAIGAQAFTHGSSIHFAPGHYDPASPRGRHLLAHELAHVVQQRAGRVRNPFGSGIAVMHDALLEAEAERMAQRAAVHAAPPAATPAVAQRKLIIGGEKVPPTGKRSKAIWEDLRFDLLDAGLSPHGLKTKYYDAILKAKEKFKYDREEEFRAVFVKTILQHLDEEDERARNEKLQGLKKKSKRTVHRFAIKRPAWPKHYREMLGAKKGDDLRHVVRNATLRRALDRELEYLVARFSSEDLLDYYQDMAKQLGVEKKDHWREQYKAIYNKLYLNPENLFAESGGVNQAIGFSADPIVTYGEKLRLAEDQPVSIETVVDDLAKIIKDNIGCIAGKAKKMKDFGMRQKFLLGFSAYQENILKYLSELGELWISEYGFSETETSTTILAEAWDLADDVIDIGDNLGFDLILADDVAERQATLVQVETQLQSGKLRFGTHELTEVCINFLAPTKKLKESKRPVSRTQRSGLVFPVGRIHRYMKQKKIAKRISPTAAVYMAAVLEYITAELVELSGEEAKKKGGRKRIVPKDIRTILGRDKELGEIFKLKDK